VWSVFSICIESSLGCSAAHTHKPKQAEKGICLALRVQSLLVVVLLPGERSMLHTLVDIGRTWPKLKWCRLAVVVLQSKPTQHSSGLTPCRRAGLFVSLNKATDAYHVLTYQQSC